MYMYPQSNSARSVRDLSGVWDFRFNANEPWQPIAVPASYNDQSPDPEFRRHYGMPTTARPSPCPRARAGCCASTL